MRPLIHRAGPDGSLPSLAGLALDSGLAALRRAASQATGRGGRNVLVTTSVPDQKTAWTKARKDVLSVLTQMGYATLQLPAMLDASGWVLFGLRLRGLVQDGGHVVLEYPFDSRKRAYLLRFAGLPAATRMYALVHDLDSLRHPGSPAGREMAILRLFDGVISHNIAMTQWLREQGLGRKALNLGLFDYCCPDGPAWHETSLAAPLQVVCAGNLSPAKAGYVYDPRLARLEGVSLSLFGPFFEQDRMRHGGAAWKGAFDPDAPALDRRYHFGLVWDGSSAEGCDGDYGHYMRYNNPHKLSLYLAMGLPVIVWKSAAIATFVRDRGVGLAVDDLREIGDAAAALGNAGYLAMAARAAALGSRVRQGGFVREAVSRLAR